MSGTSSSDTSDTLSALSPSSNSSSGSKSESENAPESPPADDTAVIVCVCAAGPPQSTSIAADTAFARDGVG